jgi:hypothetical protein
MTVDRERSTIVAPDGTSTLLPTALIFPASTTIV